MGFWGALWVFGVLGGILGSRGWFLGSQRWFLGPRGVFWGSRGWFLGSRGWFWGPGDSFVVLGMVFGGPRDGSGVLVGFWGPGGLTLRPPGTKHKTLVEARSGLGPIRAFPRGGGSGTPPAETPERSFHCQICNVRLNSELQLKQVGRGPETHPETHPKIQTDLKTDPKTRGDIPKLTPNPN